MLDAGRRFGIGKTLRVRVRSRSAAEKEHAGRGRRPGLHLDDSSGRYIMSRIPRGRARSLALDASLRAACGRGSIREGLIRVGPGDIREKLRVRPTGAAICFLVDASGSMGARQRMMLTKGLVLSLLTDAYHKRDKVALLAFRAARCDRVLPFTRSPGMARERLRELAVGGKTPLGLGIKEALRLLGREQRKNAGLRPVLIVVSDGNGNVALEYEDPYEEALHYARQAAGKKITSVFLDTESNPCDFGYGRQVARAMGAEYLIADMLVRRGIIELPF